MTMKENYTPDRFKTGASSDPVKFYTQNPLFGGITT